MHERTGTTRVHQPAGQPTMSDMKSNSSAAPHSFADSFVTSDAFRALFREGMGLVESTAAYLDGPGREQSKGLPRMVALTYASESMRLTTRLMQVASWLLLQRAVAEGELTAAQAQVQKEKVRLANQASTLTEEAAETLPQELRDLIAHSMRLQDRIIHLDALMDGPVTEVVVEANPVAQQHKLLSQAFGI
jgi:regulator of CtrA degradation